MTLFTLAGALISASHVCCVALLSAYQQTTSAALHNRSFEGFLSLGEKKKGDRKSEDNKQQKERGKTEERIHPYTDTHKHIPIAVPNPHKRT